MNIELIFSIVVWLKNQLKGTDFKHLIREDGCGPRIEDQGGQDKEVYLRADFSNELHFALINLMGVLRQYMYDDWLNGKEWSDIIYCYAGVPPKARSNCHVNVRTAPLLIPGAYGMVLEVSEVSPEAIDLEDTKADNSIEWRQGAFDKALRIQLEELVADAESHLINPAKEMGMLARTN